MSSSTASSVSSNTVSLATSNLQQMLLDPISLEPLLSPVVIPCGHRFNKKSIEVLLQTQTNPSCSLCRTPFQEYYEDILLRKIAGCVYFPLYSLNFIKGTLTSPITQQPLTNVVTILRCTHHLNQEDMSDTVSACPVSNCAQAVTSVIKEDSFFNELIALLNDTAVVTALREDADFQNDAHATCAIVTPQTLKSWNDIEHFLPAYKRLFLSHISPALDDTVSYYYIDGDERTVALFRHIFALYGKGATVAFKEGSISYTSHSSASDNTLRHISIEATNTLTITPTTTDHLILSIQELYERMILEELPVFTVQPRQRLTLTRMNPDTCQAYFQNNKLKESDDTLLSVCLTENEPDTHYINWHFPSKISLTHNRTFTILEIATTSEAFFTCSLTPCSAELHTPSSFATALAEQNEMHFAQGTCLHIEAPLSSFYTDPFVDLASVFNYLSVPAAKTFQSYTTDANPPLFHRTDRAIKIFFPSETTLLFGSHLEIETLPDLFARMQKEDISKITIPPNCNLIIKKTKYDLHTRIHATTSQNLLRTLLKGLVPQGCKLNLPKTTIQVTRWGSGFEISSSDPIELSLIY